MSAECKDLIRRIFQPDPTARITIAGIQVLSLQSAFQWIANP